MPSQTNSHGESRKAFIPVTVLALLALGFTGCSTAKAVRVQPWERAALADYSMRSDRDPLGDSLTEHVYFAREAASGGKGVGGSGCGCN